MGWRSLLDNSEIRSSNFEKSIYWDRYKILPLEAYLFWDSSLGPKSYPGFTLTGQVEYAWTLF